MGDGLPSKVQEEFYKKLYGPAEAQRQKARSNIIERLEFISCGSDLNYGNWKTLSNLNFLVI